MPAATSGVPCLDFIHRQDGDEPSTPAVERFRRLLERLLTEEARGLGAREEDLDAFNRVLSRAAASRGLTSTVRGYGWGWRRTPDPLSERLFPPAWSTAVLLTGPDRHRLKCCEGCGRLFLDASRNRSRRWCDMRDCGNRNKVRRFRSRR